MWTMVGGRCIRGGGRFKSGEVRYIRGGGHLKVVGFDI